MIGEDDYHRLAKEHYESDDIIIVDLSSADPPCEDVVDIVNDGAWVQAWVYVPDPDA